MKREVCASISYPQNTPAAASRQSLNLDPTPYPETTQLDGSCQAVTPRLLQDEHAAATAW
jgi:hypothetical protein